MILLIHPGAMPKRQKFESNTNYHVYNRWLYKQTLFHNDKDLQRFLLYIDRYKEKCKNDLSILAYSILPNHFHLVVNNISDGYRLSYFIWNICAAYARYYKAKYWIEKGKMYFECRFRAKEIIDEEYLHQCVHYVENNPLKHGLVDKVEDRLFRSVSSHPGANIKNIDRERDF